MKKSSCLIIICFLFGSSLFSQSVESFTLISADTDSEIGPLNDGDTLDLIELPSLNVNIRANTQPDTVGSVTFEFNGMPNYRTENVVPYALEGDSNGDYNAFTLSIGTHTVKATPYTESDGGGMEGNSLSITFHVIDQNPPSDSCGTTDPAPLGISGELKKWHRVTITFQGDSTSEIADPNPFTDYRLNVTFTKDSLKYVVPGYYAADGNAAESSAICGDRWRVHFAPPDTGEWTYSVSYRKGEDVAVNDDPNAGLAVAPLDGKSGTFNISPTDKRGRDMRAKGELNYVGGHFLQFAENGEYFLKQGPDAPENFLAYEDFDGDFKNDGNYDQYIKTWQPHEQDWNNGDPQWQDGKGKDIIGAINYLASEGLNAFSFIPMNIAGDDRNVFPYINYNDYTRLDCSKLDQWEIVFQHATAMGFFLHFKTQETENELLLDGGDLGRERKLYYRELIARYSHHLALNWNLGEEINNASTAQKKAWAQYFYDHDPYQHHIVIHNGANHYDLLGPDSKLTGFSLQTNRTDFANVHSRVLNYLERSVNAGKPWAVACDEPGDASHALRPDNDAGNAQEDARRNALWGTFMAGGWGNEWYFGYQHAHSDLTCNDFRSRDQWWDFCRHALEFFNDYQIPVYKMSNQNALIGNDNNTNSRFCLAKEGEVYVVYLPQGGSTDIDLPVGNYYIKWYDPRKGGDLQRGSEYLLAGGDNVSIGMPPSVTDQDWAALIYNEEMALEASGMQQDVQCHGSSDGMAEVTPNKGFPPYRFHWNTNDSTAQLQGLSPGTYSVTVTDAALDTIFVSFDIEEPDSLALSTFVTPSSSMNGSAWATYSGGTPPYQIIWLPGGQMTDSITGLDPGKYTAILSDANDCIDSSTVIVENATSTTERIGDDCLKVFPNPVSNFANIQLQDCSPISSIKLYDTNGRLYYNRTNIHHQLQIDTSQLESGLYVLQAINSNGASYHQKLIIL